MQNTPFVSVIIPVYNDYERLALCLAALEKQTYPRERFEIIVVDNGSANIPARPIPVGVEAKWLQERTVGSYAARNKGISCARGHVLAFLDSDCIPRSEWIQNGVETLARMEGPGYVAGRIDLFPKGELPTWTELYEAAMAFPIRDNLETLHFGCTANLYVSREIIERVGRFTQNLQSGGDFEFGKRVYQAGFPQAYADDVIVDHPARHSITELLAKAYRTRAGAFDLAAQGNLEGAQIISGLWRHFKLPMRKVYRILRTGKIQGWSNKARAASVQLALHYALAWETLRIKRGGNPKGKRTAEGAAKGPL